MKLSKEQKSIEARVRRAAARRGLRIARSCARNPKTSGYGLYWWGSLSDAVPQCSVYFDQAFNLTLAYIAECLCGYTGEESQKSA